ncbi:MAG: 4'-phosphopantetheinyl transferase superfamily protein [Tannerella sp.]|jgi:phosphopantetheinyl transferase|nr:4'-phosphopantetheinyl transferase superfamily protein [Tannerella sp.]
MPLLLTRQSPVMGIWKSTEPWQDMLESFRNKEIYSHDVLKIQSDKRKQEWLAVRLLLKHLSGSETPISYHDNGAPFLCDSPYHISISHTVGYAAVILSKNPNPGIDIEYRSERAWKLRHKYMGKKEQEMFTLLCGDKQTGDEKHSGQTTLATVCWCAKETAYKALRKTEVDFIEHLHVLPFTLFEKGNFLLKETKTSKQEVFNIHYQITEDFIITWKE